jgi:hypothetical protein
VLQEHIFTVIEHPITPRSWLQHPSRKRARRHNLSSTRKRVCVPRNSMFKSKYLFFFFPSVVCILYLQTRLFIEALVKPARSTNLKGINANISEQNHLSHPQLSR